VGIWVKRDAFFSRGWDEENGIVQGWLDNNKIVDFSGPTAYENGKDLFYFKFGLYRDRMKRPMKIFFD
jgi:hypothetical protein